MSNEEIIMQIAMHVLDPNEVRSLMESGIEPPLHTYSGWRTRGYQVKKGSEGIPCRLWKQRKKSKKEDEGEDEEENSGFILCNAYLFTLDQVEKIKNERG